jgi:hypothetical protein
MPRLASRGIVFISGLGGHQVDGNVRDMPARCP